MNPYDEKVNRAFNEARKHLSYLSDHVALTQKEKALIGNQMLILDWIHHDVTIRLEEKQHGTAVSDGPH